jgi:hypothetical protein
MHERTESRGFGAAPFQETIVEMNVQECNRFVRRRIEIRILASNSPKTGTTPKIDRDMRAFR